jgi:hypothetical protein
MPHLECARSVNGRRVVTLTAVVTLGFRFDAEPASLPHRNRTHDKNRDACATRAKSEVCQSINPSHGFCSHLAGASAIISVPLEINRCEASSWTCRIELP